MDNEYLRDLWLKLGGLQVDITNMVNHRNRIMYALARNAPFLEMKVYAESQQKDQEVCIMRKIGAGKQYVFFWYPGGPGRAAGFYCGDSSRKAMPPGEKIMMHRVVPITTKDKVWSHLVRTMLRSSVALKYDVVRQRRTA